MITEPKLSDPSQWLAGEKSAEMKADADEMAVYLEVFVRQVELKVQRVHSLRQRSGGQLLQRVPILTQLGQSIFYQDHFIPHPLYQHTQAYTQAHLREQLNRELLYIKQMYSVALHCCS